MINKHQIKGEKARINEKPVVLYVGTADEIKGISPKFTSGVSMEEIGGNVCIFFERGSRIVDLLHLFLCNCRDTDSKDDHIARGYALALGQCMEHLLKMGGNVLG